MGASVPEVDWASPRPKSRVRSQATISSIVMPDPRRTISEETYESLPSTSTVRAITSAPARSMAWTAGRAENQPIWVWLALIASASTE